MRVLYTGEHYRLSSCEVTDSDLAIITFNPLSDQFFPDVPGDFANPFAYSVFSSLGASEYHITSNKNDWFLHDEIKTVLDELKVYIQGKKAVCYGSSMGAFAAAHYSSYLGARFVVFSPQYSIDPS